MKSNHYNKESYIEKQVSFFRKYAVNGPKLLGMEFEHFLLDADTLRSYDYFEPNGQRQMMEALSHRGWEILLEEEGNILGLKKNGSTITLEPGGQVEISLKPFESIFEIQHAYMAIIDEIDQVLASNQMLAGIGYHPVTKINDLSLLPKKRYGMMYNYFKNNGAYCHNMMKGTAATQVSIDFDSEMDFIKKFRVANYLSPAMASLFDATPFFEGALTEGTNMRARIWAETDIKRSKLIPGSLTLQFGFEEYVNYLLKLPPILLYAEGKLVFSENETLETALSHYNFYDEELEHHLSMVFPDVRLKQFIEIRMPDSLPYPYNLGVAALIKGIFYNSCLLEKYYEKSLAVDDAWVELQNNNLKMSLIDESLQTLKREILNDVIEVLTDEERAFMRPILEVFENEGSFTALMQRTYREDIEAFKQLIKIQEVGK
jgi:glutamate--cysteine ligase